MERADGFAASSPPATRYNSANSLSWNLAVYHLAKELFLLVLDGAVVDWLELRKSGIVLSLLLDLLFEYSAKLCQTRLTSITLDRTTSLTGSC